MVAYTLRRLAGSPPTLLTGLTLTFFFIHLAPGDPSLRFLSPVAGVELQNRIIENFGLNQPLIIQYFTWLKRVLLHFDFGNSFISGQATAEIIKAALPPTLLLTGLALLFGVLGGMAMGIWSAVKYNTGIDRGLTILMLVFYSMPTFLIGLWLLGLFSVGLNWLPASQLTSVYHDQLSWSGRLVDYIRHLILPVASLTLITLATFGRYLRASMVEVLQADYINAARARGITNLRIIYVYALRNALLPVISLLGTAIPILFSGAVVIEVIFALPGMGRVSVDAVLARDYPVILAVSTMAFVSVIIGNLLSDIGYALVDPRVQLDGKD